MPNTSVFDILQQQKSFGLYLRQSILPHYMANTLDALQQNADIYVFSGIIRNFFTGDIDNNHDLDLVINVRNFSGLRQVQRIISHTDHRFNSFGGLKINIPHMLPIDAWGLRNTWNIRHAGLTPSEENLIGSVFFNFSAIAFHYNTNRLIFNNHFANFQATNTMEIVNPRNPLPELCALNIYHYHHKYGFKIGNTVSQWLKLHYRPDTDFIHVQLRHWGKIRYLSSSIHKFLLQCIK